MYTVYMHRNRLNNKVYIGQTVQVPEKRWIGGLGYSKSSRFWNAIQKYGWDTFDHEILCTGLTAEEANDMEIQLIAEYDSTNPEFGYNILHGGSRGVNPDKCLSVLQYSLDCQLLQSFASQHEAERATGVSNSNIGKACRGEIHTAGGYVWRYEDSPLKETPEEIAAKIRTGRLVASKLNSIIIECLYPDGSVKEYASIREAARECEQKFDRGTITSHIKSGLPMRDNTIWRKKEK